jgi:hypothetical protein
MGSTGRAVGFVVGAVAGFMTGGIATAFTYGMYGMSIGGIIDPPKGPHLYGPRLDDLSVQTSTYGAPVSRIYGTVAVTGNIIYLEHNRLREVSTTSRSGKGGGQKQTTFAYYATFAVGLCEGPVAAVKRIWISDRLIYDAGSEDLSAIIASNQSVSSWKLYKGDHAQLPDPRIEAVKGVGKAPAYRGLAYLMFYDLALGDYGNSLAGAQIKVEIVKSGTRTWHVDTVGVSPPSAFYSSPFTIWTDGVITWSAQWRNYNSSPPNNLLVIRRQIGQAPPEVVAEFRIAADGVSGYTNTDFNPAQSSELIVAVSHFLDGYSVIYKASGIFASLPTGAARIHRAGFIDGDRFYYVPTTNNSKTIVWDGRSVAITEPAWSIGYSESHIFVVRNEISSTVMRIMVLDIATLTETVYDFTGLFNIHQPIITGETGKRAKIYTLGKMYQFDDGALTLFAAPSFPQPFSSGNTWYLHTSGDIAYLAHYNSDGSAVCKINYPVLSDAPEPLADIIEAEALKSKLLLSTDLQLSDLDEDVRGYRIASVSAIRGGLDQLQGAWPFDVVQSGYDIRFVRRGKTSIAVIPADKLGAVSATGQSAPRLSTAREMDSVLPSKVAIKYLEPARDYDQGEQLAERINTPSVNTQSIDMAVVLTADEAAQVADVLLYMYWLERYDVKFTLPPEYLYLEPSDVVTVEVDGATYELRLTSISYTAEGPIECQAKYNSAAIYTSTAQGYAGSSSSQAIALAGPTRYELLDVPVLADQFDSIGWPLAMTGFSPDWTGGVLMRSDDSGQTWTDVAGVTNPGAIMGQVTTDVLAAAPSDRIDKIGVLTVNLSDDVFSVTELQMLNGQNHFAYGRDGRWEIIAAQNCVLNVDGSYTLTDFLRGRFGTEWATGTHTQMDAIIGLSAHTLQWVGMNINTVGLQRSWRGVTLDASLDSDTNRDATYRGVNLKPLSPVYLNGNRISNNWSLTWIRRTRVGGEMRDGVDVPLSEASEAYDVEIYDGAGYTTVKRTLSVTSPAASYSSSDQTADFGSAQGTLYLKIYQKSATIGRGYPLQSSISR